MLRIIFIALFLIIGCESEKNTGSLHIVVGIDTTVARIGDVINLDIVAQNTGEKLVRFPDIQGTESMEIRNKTILTNRNEPHQVSFNIVFWDTGSFTIPEYPVEILSADSTVDLTISTDSIDIKIISMFTGAEDKNLRPIKDPIAVKTPINWNRWLLAMLLLVLLLIFLSLIRKRIKKEVVEQDEITQYQSAKDIAIMRLDELKKLLDNDDKIFYLNASFMVREFIENQYYIRALEMTTVEIGKFESDYELDKNNFNNLIGLLDRADLAKFAKYKFTNKDKEIDYNWIFNFITKFSDS